MNTLPGFFVSVPRHHPTAFSLSQKSKQNITFFLIFDLCRIRDPGGFALAGVRKTGGGQPAAAH